jgi:hypothetical protein
MGDLDEFEAPQRHPEATRRLAALPSPPASSAGGGLPGPKIDGRQ